MIPACIVYSPYGVTRSADEVVAATIATIHAFPEDEAHHLAVAWGGDEAAGFYTSHLGWSRMVNDGVSTWGPATGRVVERRFAADCISRGNRIHTEWLVSDEGALVRGLGMTVDEAAAIVAAGPPRERRAAPGVAAETDPATAEGWIRRLYADLWMRQRLDRLDGAYAPDAAAHWPGARTGRGPGGVARMVAELLASLRHAVMAVEHVCWSEETDGVIVAVRWRLAGATKRGGSLGDRLSEGRPISILGISHHRFRGRRIAEEWVVFDEVAAVADAMTG